MTFMFTVSPDFSPDHLPGWFVFNTWLQRVLGEAMHLEIYDDFHSQKQAILQDKVDLIYANPYDAAMLVREKGFLPLARPKGHSDEAIIAVHAENKALNVEQLQPGIRVAATDDPDVRMMGMIMLEPGDLDSNNIGILNADNYVMVAKSLIHKNADIGIFLAEAYDDFSNIISNQLRILVRSEISVINHALLIGPKLSAKKEQIQTELIAMASNAKGTGVLDTLGYKSWEQFDDKQMEYMIDLMDTLTM